MLVVGAVAALHNLYRSGDGTADLIGWAGLLLLAMTALGGGIKLALWGAKPVTDAGFAAAKARVPEPVQAVAASGVVIAGALGMWWVFRGGYSGWWQHLTGESRWTLLLGVGQMLVAVLAGAALFTGGKYLTGLAKEVLTDVGVLLERDRTSGSGAASESVWHPGLVAALVGGGLGLVLLTAGITPRLYVWITGPDVLPAVGAIAFVLLWAIGSNLGWWKGLGGLYTWATDASQKAAATAGVVSVLMFSASGLGLGWFTPATVPVARAACPPDCGGPSGSDGPPGGGQMFQPPSQGGPQMPDYQGGINQPPMDQNGSVSIYNTQAPSVSNNGANGFSGQQGSQQGWDQPAHGTQPPDYQNATPYTQGPGRPNPDFNPGSQGGQANPGSNAGSQGGQPNQGVQQPAQQPQQAPRNQPPQQNTGQQPNQRSDQQKIDDLTRQLQEKQQQSSQDRQRLDDLTKQLQQNKQNQKQDLPRFPSRDDKKDRDQQEQQDRDEQSGSTDLASLLLGAASTRRRKQEDQERGPETQALGQDTSQAAQSLPGDIQTYVQSGQQIGQSSGQAAQGFGSATQAGASLASSAQSGAVNPQDAITLVQGVSQGIQGTADAVNAGSQIVKTAQGEADQVAQAVGDANPQLKPQTEQFIQLNDTVSKGTEGVGQIASGVSQVSGMVNTASSLGTSGMPDTSGATDALSGTATAVDVPKPTPPSPSAGSLSSLPGVGETQTLPQQLAPTLQPDQVDAFRAITRQNLVNQHVPADQIDQRVNDAVKQAQTPRFMPDPEPMRTPGAVPLDRPLGDRFNDVMGRANDRASDDVDGLGQLGKNLTGQGGPGAPGVAESWKDLGKGTGEAALDALSNPGGGFVKDGKRLVEEPGNFIGDKIIEAPLMGATLPFGGEGAAIGRGALGKVAPGAEAAASRLTVDEVIANPQMLAGKTPQQVQAALGDVPGWQVESLGKGSQAGNGWVLRQYNEKGNPTGPQIRWHPGGGHHGPDPYWRVVGPQGDLGGVIR
ncbi:YIP1 family protein [Mycobacterium sp. D16Q16]|uniref:YIP1 family protein n=1 Tax=Mycobacterium sp. D16Q16 TaxID=1855659 RepID=UPI00336BDE2C